MLLWLLVLLVITILVSIGCIVVSERFCQALVDGLAVGVGALTAVVDGLGGSRVDFGVVVNVSVGFDQRAGDAIVLQSQCEYLIGQRGVLLLVDVGELLRARD